jgi:hypothetical protein
LLGGPPPPSISPSEPQNKIKMVTVSDEASQQLRADVLALASGLGFDAYDPELLDDPAVVIVMDDLEAADPVQVGLVGALLVFGLARDLAAVTGELAEDLLQRLALAAALHPINRPDY